MKDRLIREIQDRQKQYNTNISIKDLNAIIDCSTENGVEIARDLGRHSRAHIVICGKLLIDHQEYFLDVVVVNRIRDLRTDISRYKIRPIPPDTPNFLSFKKIAITEITDLVSFIFGIAKYESAQYQEAINILKTIKDQQSISLFYLGMSSDLLDKAEQALYYYDLAIELQPDLVEAWNNKSIVLNALNRPDEALLAENKLIDLQPGNAAAWLNKGYLLTTLGKFKEALDATNKGLDLKPDDVKGLHNKGMILETLHRYPEALEAVNRAINLKPDMAQAWEMKAVILIRLDSLDEALISAQKAIILDPERAEAYYNLACVYALRNDKKNAIGNLEIAIRRDNRLLRRIKTDEDLKNLRNDETFKKLLE